MDTPDLIIIQQPGDAQVAELDHVRIRRNRQRRYHLIRKTWSR